MPRTALILAVIEMASQLKDTQLHNGQAFVRLARTIHIYAVYDRI
jgi:hypothetical protein